MHLTPLALQLALTQKPRLMLGCANRFAIAVRDTLVYSYRVSVKNSTIAVPVSGSTSIDLTHVEVRDLGCMVQLRDGEQEGETLIQHISYAEGECQPH